MLHSELKYLLPVPAQEYKQLVIRKGWHSFMPSYSPSILLYLVRGLGGHMVLGSSGRERHSEHLHLCCHPLKPN